MSSEGNAEFSFGAVGEQIGLLLQHAHDVARDITKRAEEEAALIVAAAREEADSVNARAATTLREAETRATVIRAQAERAAAEERKKAERDARALLKKAQTEATEQVGQIERRIARLQQVEAVLRDRLKAHGAVVEEASARPSQR